MFSKILLHPLRRSARPLLLTRENSSSPGTEFLKAVANNEVSTRAKKKVISSSEHLKMLNNRQINSSKGKVSKKSVFASPWEDYNQKKHQKPSHVSRGQKNQHSLFSPSTPPSHQKPKPKDEDIFINFDPLTFKYKLSQSDRENEFYTEKLKQVFSINSRFEVMAIGGQGGASRMKLKTFLRRLEEDEAFDVVDIQTVDDIQFPIVRATNKVATLKTFSDKRAVEVTKMFGRTHERKRTGNLNFIKISWEISQNDLENQKTNEITSQLKKGNKLTIAIDTKDNLQDSRYAFEADTISKGGQLNKLEELRRQKAFEYLKTILEENGTVEYNGAITGKMIITVTPKAKVDNKAAKKTEKNKKKQERLEKQRMREEAKKAEREARERELQAKLAEIEA